MTFKKQYANKLKIIKRLAYLNCNTKVEKSYHLYFIFLRSKTRAVTSCLAQPLLAEGWPFSSTSFWVPTLTSWAGSWFCSCPYLDTSCATQPFQSSSTLIWVCPGCMWDTFWTDFLEASLVSFPFGSLPTRGEYRYPILSSAL